MAGQRNRYDYQEYRGRSGARSVLIFIIVLLAILFIAGEIFMFFMGDYIRYSDAGMEFDWPWLHQEDPAPPSFSDWVVVESGGMVVTAGPTAEPVSPLTPDSRYEALAAVTVTGDQLRGGTAAQAVADAGGNALVVEMKSATGRLAWQSRTEQAASLHVNAADNRVADAIRDLAWDEELYLIARVHCFGDPVLASAWVGPLMTQEGRIWYDSDGISWSSPANQPAADYLTALCLELADMGFDEILLDDAGYPCLGEVDTLATDDNRPEDRTVPVSAFLQRLAGELQERGVRLSVYTSEELLRNEEVYSGMTAGRLARSAGRVWLDGRVDRDRCEGVLSAAGLNNVAARVVAPAEATERGSWYR